MKHFFIFFFLISFTACQTVPKKQPVESRDDVISAVEKVSGAVTAPGGKQIKAEDLVRELRTNEEARSAMKSIEEGFAPERHIVRYCPETGEHFGPGVDVCPGSGTPLVEIIEEY